MRKILLLFLLFVIIFIVGCKESIEKNYVSNDFKGDWFQEDYVNNLIKTRSPVKWKKNVAPLYFSIREQDDKLTFSLASNLHYADYYACVIDDLEKINNSNRYIFRFEKKDISKMIIEPISNSKVFLDILNNNYKSQRMIKVSSVNYNEFINEVVLAGNYISDDGVSSSFSIEGEAKLPNVNQNFKYEINLDSSLQKYDWFRDKTNNKVYVFKWEKERLYIYNEADPSSEIVMPTGNPIILTRIN